MQQLVMESTGKLKTYLTMQGYLLDLLHCAVFRFCRRMTFDLRGLLQQVSKYSMAQSILCNSLILLHLLTLHWRVRRVMN